MTTTSEHLPLPLRHTVKIAVREGLFRVRRKVDGRLHRSTDSIEAERAIAKCKEWLLEYVAKPHDRLGRSGDVCPFVHTSLNRGRMSFAVYENATRMSERLLADLIIHEALTFSRQLDKDAPDRELSAINLLFPNLAEEDHSNLDRAHTLCKTVLMRRGMMVAVFFDGYTRPAINNPDFPLYQSPLPVVTIRPMALHDIAFLERSAFGFAEYRRRFGNRYLAGKVSPRFGYVERFEQAEVRFGYRPG